MTWPRGWVREFRSCCGYASCELAPIGAFGLHLGFGAFGPGTLSIGEGALRFELGSVAVAECVPLAGGIGAGPLVFGPGIRLGLASAADLCVSGGSGVASRRERSIAFAVHSFRLSARGSNLLAGGGLSGSDLPGHVATELIEFGAQSTSCFFSVASCGFGGGHVVAGGGEGFGESLGFRFGFGLARLRGDGRGFGAPTGGLSIGDLGADPGVVKPRGLVAGGLDEDSCLPHESLDHGKRFLVPAAATGRDAGIVVVTPGTIVAAKHPVPATARTRRDGIAAAGSLADQRARIGILDLRHDGYSSLLF